MKTFRLEHNLHIDITRPVNDMAAYFGYKLAENADTVLPLDWEQVLASLPTDAPSGEVTRYVKLAVLQAFERLTGEHPVLPWGILTGVRPGKLVHKLLDEGVPANGAGATASTAGDEHLDVVDILQRDYLLPRAQGELLRDIVLRQKQLLPDATRFTDAGIYIGVPFCPSRCSYCSFPAGIVPQDEESQQNFVNMIEQDVQNVVQLLSMHKDLHVKSLYIGGGTPTSLHDKVFARLLHIVQTKLHTSDVIEFTVEAGRPDCFTAAKLAAMENAGVNRISVNPQTFHDKTLRAIGRAHTVADFYRAYEAVRKSSIPVINMDLILGLPGETEADIVHSLQEAAKLAPENLTVHTLTLKKSAPLFGAQDMVSLDAAAAARCVEQGRQIAAEMGFVPYYLYRQHYMLGHLANIGYAKPGTESIYNIQMMEERHPVLGIGPSSASKVPLPDGHHLNKLNMPKNVAVYAANLADINKKRAQLFEI